MAKAVIFDKDGVLIHTIELYYERWKLAFLKQGKKLSKDYYAKNIMGRSAKDNIRKHLGPDITNEDLTKILQEQLRFTLKNFNKYVSLVTGVANFLAKLKSANIPIALATSSRRETTEHVLATFKLKKYFAAVITGDDILQAKPDPEIFLTAAKNLGVKPQDCVVFEDSYSGVEAAKRAGMKVVLVMTSHTRAEIPNVDLAIKDFTKLTLKDVISL